MSENSNSLLAQLVTSIFKHTVDPRGVTSLAKLTPSDYDHLVSFSSTILESALAPDRTLDERRISKTIQTMLVRETRIKEAQRYQALHRQLSAETTSPLSHRWALFYTLHSLMDLSDSTGSDATTATPLVGLPPLGVPTSLPKASALPWDSLNHQLALLSGGISTVSSGGKPPKQQQQQQQQQQDLIPARCSTELDHDRGDVLDISIFTSTSPTALPTRMYHPPSVTRATVELTPAGDDEVGEVDLIRDVLFAMQGIEGSYIRYDTQARAYTIDPTVGIAEPTRRALQRLVQVGCFYRWLRDYVRTRLDAPGISLVEQALCAAVQQELCEYQRMVATLDAQLPPALRTTSALTLRKLRVWIFDPEQRFDFLWSLLTQAGDARGGR
ncbi:putative gamma-tubulin complex component 3 [Paratrimastix pyriformis]|uniref:Gamma-tubulin complex component 3 n=1 Tax=Paratrimastix pyriformis TaxID=342808 RepID=A0ABQ8U6N5_9EUKA|nr:putative gamma-tubulin complex component 3 [Paratrimastix pyriformis]